MKSASNPALFEQPPPSKSDSFTPEDGIEWPPRNVENQLQPTLRNISEERRNLHKTFLMVAVLGGFYTVRWKFIPTEPGSAGCCTPPWTRFSWMLHTFLNTVQLDAAHTSLNTIQLDAAHLPEHGSAGWCTPPSEPASKIVSKYPWLL
jgi:hypothetical protein